MSIDQEVMPDIDSPDFVTMTPPPSMELALLPQPPPTTTDLSVVITSQELALLPRDSGIVSQHSPAALVGSEFFILTPSLPYLTPTLSGIGGFIKQIPSHFSVTENIQVIPDNKRDKNNDGCHYFITLTREGMNTGDLQSEIAQVTGNKPVDIGVCGLKDKHARCTQTFSVPSYHAGSKTQKTMEEITETVLTAIPSLTLASPVAVNSTKLRRNNHSGNTFKIVISSLAVSNTEALQRCNAIVAALTLTGYPNYYGDQRFGATGGGALRGLRLLQAFQDGGKKEKKKAKASLCYTERGKFTAAAFASMCFNVWLARRIEKGQFGGFVVGDLAVRPFGDKPEVTTTVVEEGSRREQKQKAWKKKQSKSKTAENPKQKATEIKDVNDVAIKTAWETGELTFSGPMFGAKGLKPSGAAALAENIVSNLTGIKDRTYAECDIWGNRRAGRMPVGAELGLRVAECEEGIVFEFTLPTGAYATTLLREFVKGAVERPEEGGGEERGKGEEEVEAKKQRTD